MLRLDLLRRRTTQASSSSSSTAPSTPTSSTPDTFIDDETLPPADRYLATVRALLTRQDGKHATKILLAFWFVFLLGAPVWYQTTRVYRAPLPLHEMRQDFQFKEPAIQLHVIQMDEKVEDVSLLKVNRAIVWEVLHWPLKSEMPRDSNKWDDWWMSSLSEKQLEQFKEWSNSPGHFVYISLPRQTPSKTVSKHGSRYAFSTESLSTLSSRLTDLLFPFQLETHQKTLQPSSRFQLTFSLLVSDPDQVQVSWDIESGLKAFIQPFLTSIQHLAPVDMDSQILYYATPNLEPEWNEEEKYWMVESSKLPHFIHAAEWPLVSAVVPHQSIHCLLFVSGKEAWHLVNEKREKLQEQAYLVPQWGSVILASMPSTNDTWHLDKDQLRPFMSLFLSHLRELFGFEPLTHQHKTLAPLPQELDIRTMQDTFMLLQRSRERLQRLANLIETLPNMVVADVIEALVSTSLNELRLAEEAIHETQWMKAHRHAKQAFTRTTEAFFHPSLVAMLYFPDDHRYAVYTPLFFPMSLPLIVATLKMIQQVIQKQRKTQ